MTTMKESTTCGRREMRALYEARQTNVAPVETRARIVIDGNPPRAVTVRPNGRKVRDHGTAAWNSVVTAALARPRNERRITARIVAKSNNSDRDLDKSSRIIARNRRTRVTGLIYPKARGHWGAIKVAAKSESGR